LETERHQNRDEWQILDVLPERRHALVIGISHGTIPEWNRSA